MSDYLCGYCDDEIVRIARKWWQYPAYSELYACSRCGRKLALMRFAAFISPHRCCPKCGKPKIDRLQGFDPMDKLYLNPISLLQGLILAPLWRCHGCRIQFFDYRPGLREPQPAAAPNPYSLMPGLSRLSEVLGGAEKEAASPIPQVSKVAEVCLASHE